MKNKKLTQEEVSKIQEIQIDMKRVKKIKNISNKTKLSKDILLKS
jgi:hypothetical protein